MFSFFFSSIIIFFFDNIRYYIAAFHYQFSSVSALKSCAAPGISQNQNKPMYNANLSVFLIYGFHVYEIISHICIYRALRRVYFPLPAFQFSMKSDTNWSMSLERKELRLRTNHVYFIKLIKS